MQALTAYLAGKAIARVGYNTKCKNRWLGHNDMHRVCVRAARIGRATARWLGSIPNRLTNFLNTTNNPIDRKVRTMIRSFACDYETLKRLAEIETDAILYQGDAEMIGAAEGREIALRTVLSEIERA